MKLFLAILFSMTILGASAQTYLPVPTPSFNNSDLKNKWQLRPFASLSAGYIFLNGGISYLSAPMGLALYRPLNTNWTAYGAATVTPTFFNINRLSALPINDPNYHGYPFSGVNGLGLTPGVQGGLIYTNDAKTFSISGSVRFEKSNYPVYYPSNRLK
ncbi:MAG: hypothetical protein J0H74_21460 [Chitinophagaceae bacterium]|nr:hypothetical protein [Chitinophagaceae bacterium]